MPANNPSPVKAQQAWICQLCPFNEVSLSSVDISAADIAPLTSCLLAKISTLALGRSCEERGEGEGDEWVTGRTARMGVAAGKDACLSVCLFVCFGGVVTRAEAGAGL